MHLSTHPTSYPTRYQEIAAKLEQECANRDIDNMRVYTDKELIDMVG